MNYPTINDLVEFIWKNKGKTFKWAQTKDQIAVEMARHIQDGSMLFSTDLSGNLTGMILAEIDHEKKIVFVTENLSMCLATLRIFAAKAKLNWPDYTLKWMKNGIYKNHNTARIYKKLASI